MVLSVSQLSETKRQPTKEKIDKAKKPKGEDRYKSKLSKKEIEEKLTEPSLNKREGKINKGSNKPVNRDNRKKEEEDKIMKELSKKGEHSFNEKEKKKPRKMNN